MANTKMMHLADGQGGREEGKLFLFLCLTPKEVGELTNCQNYRQKRKNRREGKGGSGQATYAVGERGGGAVSPTLSLSPSVPPLCPNTQS